MGLLDWLGLTIVKTNDFDSLVAQLKKAQDDNFALKQTQNIAEPKKLGLITLKEIHTLLSPLCQTFISDEIFNTTSKEEAMKFTAETKVQNDKWVAENHDCPIPEELAWAYGLFFTDGTCGIDKNGSAFWKITNTNKEFLERAKNALEDYWKEFEFRIENYPSEEKGKRTNLGIRKNKLYNLILYSKDKTKQGRRKEWIQTSRNTFYFNDYKKLPKCMFDNKRIVKKAFLMGALAGNGTKTDNVLTINGKIGLAGIMDMMYDCGWKWSIKRDLRHRQVFTIRYKMIDNPELMLLPPCCDNFSFALMGYWSQGLYSFPLGIAWSGLHAFNIMVDDDKQIWIIEPQTNKWMTLEEAKVNPMYFPLRVIMI